MATIVKRGNKYQAQVCVRGVRISKSFHLRADAKKWALQQEIAIETGERVAHEAITLAELMQRYERQVAPTKSNLKYDRVKCRWWAKSELGPLLLDDLSAKDFEAFQERRLQEVASSSVRREFILLNVALNWGVRKGYLASNPLQGVKRAKDAPHRERTASDEEIQKICAAAGWDPKTPPVSQTARVAAAFLLSCLTGMRGGEILQIRSEWIDGNVLHLPATATKTRLARDVALQDSAVELIRQVQSLGLGEPIFAVNSANKDAIFRKLRDRAGLREERDAAGNVIREALHFHDGRATFCTWAASPGKNGGAPRLDVLALARQLGHGDLKMLQKYYRPSAKELADRLDE